MPRFAPVQPDLFAPLRPAAAPEAPPAPPEKPPLEELREVLALVQGADKLPWPDLQSAMAVESRCLGLAKQAGEEGEKLLAAIFAETERLFHEEEEAMMAASRSYRPG
jgi:hypothetical protein